MKVGDKVMHGTREGTLVRIKRPFGIVRYDNGDQMQHPLQSLSVVADEVFEVPQKASEVKKTPGAFGRK